MLELDHVVLAVTDLEEAGQRLRSVTGLGSVPGGTHERWGTANRIVPLGPHYLELIAIHDRSVARTTALGRRIEEAAGSSLPWMTWVVRTADLSSVAHRIGLDVTEGGRERPDGRTLRWRMAGLEEALAEPPLPFFQEWAVRPEEHPGAARAEHVVRPRGIAWIEAAGDGARLRRWLGQTGLAVMVVEGTPGIRRVGIRTADGELVLDGSEVSPASA